MAQRRFHYDGAFEHYLRAKAIPYVAVDEAKKAMQGARKLKSFDFVVYAENGPNLLVDVKGRKHSGRSRRQLDNWVTHDDVTDLLQWEEVFGTGFEAALVFLFWCEAQPPDALFHEIYEHRGRWYAVLAMRVREYAQHMTERSPKWNTVHVPASVFNDRAMPLMSMLNGANRTGGRTSK
ncbi:MAG: hypothetical protein GC162_16025 [Planctomycetes bacterium]|nr:hypothetical protein [Planctomycetota bacterium]